jgi:elongation factor 2
LTDSLLNKAGIISDKDTGTKRGTDVHKQEEERGITINSTGISLQYTLPESRLPKDSNGRDFLINLIDSPGHVDFNCEVTAALRVTDGALVVVDAVEGACVQTETVLRQALMERIKPVLMINKVDRFLFEKEYEPEDCYRQFQKVIGEINLIIDTYQNEKVLGDVKFDPSIGTVAFGSGYYAWGFTLDNVAEFWSKQTGDPKEKFLKRMWTHESAFVKYVIGPIVQLKKFADSKSHDKIFKFAEKIGIRLTSEDKELAGKKLVNCILKKWYPASDALLQMIVQKLPSPDKAQQYRAEALYSGPKDDQISESIKRCDPNGPLMVYISKMVPNKDFSKFYAFGRVFSGTIKGGKKIIFYGTEYEHGKESDVYKNISPSNVYAMMANKMQPMEECPAGNTVCLAGLDQYILKNGTISDIEGVYPFHAMKFTVSPVVRIAVNVKNPAHLPKFLKALDKLSKSDPLCKIDKSESGETIIAGAGELHIDVILNNLRTDYCKDIAFNTSPPVVPFRETIQSTSPSCLAKSPNKHNRLWIKAEPLREDLVRDIENGQFDWKIDPQAAARELIDKYGWDPNEANPKRVWMFGPEGDCTNVVIDGTSGVQYMQEIKDSVLNGFKRVCYSGVLCDEPLRGVKFVITDCTLHADNIHRGGGQIISTAWNAMYAAQLLAEPCLTEPIFQVDVTVPDECMGAVYNVISQRRGQVTEQTNVDGTPMYKLKGTLPVMESFGFDAALRGETSGQAFQQCSFLRWDKMTGSTDNPESRLMKTIADVRTRKGKSAEIPDADVYRDKL